MSSKLLILIGLIITAIFSISPLKVAKENQREPYELYEIKLSTSYEEIKKFVKGEQHLPQVLFRGSQPKPTPAKPLQTMTVSISPIKEELEKIFIDSNKINQDVKGILYMPNTKIKSPIVHSEIPEYYLDRNLEKQIDKIGTPYMHYSQKSIRDEVNLIQGHNLKNGEAFSDMAKYIEENFAKENKTIYLFDGVHLYKCTIFSIKILDATSESLPLDFKTVKEKESYYNEISNKSYLELDKPDISKRLLILSTCTSVRQQDRIVLWATIDTIIT